MSGHVVVFVGPTMPGSAAAERYPGVDVRPPAAHGDLAHAARDGAATIVLVDGVFDWVRAVWHKEILWALSNGVRVIGASSMGALRAAECAAFGMEPVGVVALDYLHGRRTRDGDVAQAHAAGDDGWRPLSEALVNVEATIGAAVDVGALASHDAALLGASARRCFYAERVWPKVIAEAGLAADVAAATAAWVRRHAVDQKRLDAELALAVARETEPSTTPRFELASTSFWRRAVAELETREQLRRRVRTVPLAELVD